MHCFEFLVTMKWDCIINGNALYWYIYIRNTMYYTHLRSMGQQCYNDFHTISVRTILKFHCICYMISQNDILQINSLISSIFGLTLAFSHIDTCGQHTRVETCHILHYPHTQFLGNYVRKKYYYFLDKILLSNIHNSCESRSMRCSTKFTVPCTSYMALAPCMLTFLGHQCLLSFAYTVYSKTSLT